MTPTTQTMPRITLRKDGDVITDFNRRVGCWVLGLGGPHMRFYGGLNGDADLKGFPTKKALKTCLIERLSAPKENSP